MKILRLIPPLLLSLILVGCQYQDGNFCDQKARIILKTQSNFDKGKNQAKYEICWTDPNRGYIEERNLVLIMPEDFGEPGDIIVFENGKMTVQKRKVNVCVEK
jgi:hypothetical protein